MYHKNLYSGGKLDIFIWASGWFLCSCGGRRSGHQRGSLTSHDFYFMPENKHCIHVTTLYSNFKISSCLLTVYLPVFLQHLHTALIQYCTVLSQQALHNSSSVCQTHTAEVKQWLLGLFINKHRHSGELLGRYRPLMSLFKSILSIHSSRFGPCFVF